MSTVLNIHDVEKINIRKISHKRDETCHEFIVVRIETRLRDGTDGPSVDLFMDHPKICVRSSGGSLTDRTIEVVR